MRIGQVIGKVVTSRLHPSLVGAQFKIVLPLTFDDLANPDPVEHAERSAQELTGLDAAAQTDAAVNRLLNPKIHKKFGGELVVYDSCSASIGEWLAFSEGAEAAAAFSVEKKAPVDAYAAAIIDTVTIDPEAVATLKK